MYTISMFGNLIASIKYANLILWDCIISGGSGNLVKIMYQNLLLLVDVLMAWCNSVTEAASTSVLQQRYLWFIQHTV